MYSMLYLVDSKDLSVSNNKYQLKGYTVYGSMLMRLNKIMIPYSFYNVMAGKNTLITSLGTVTITPGQYDVDDLRSALETALIVLDATFTVAYSNLTKKFTIARTGNFDLTLSTSTINTLIGFGKVDKTGAATYTSDNVFDINNCQYLTMHSKRLNENNGNITTDGREGFICCIPVNVSTGSTIVFYPNYPIEYEYNRYKSITDDEIWFQHEDTSVINFNGCNWQMEMEFL
jgi:hypothetical protein